MQGLNKQELVVINGPLNGGKTILFNLFKKDSNYICLDLTIDHYEIHEKEMFDLIGKSNTLGLKSAMEDHKIFQGIEVFFSEIGFLMKEFPYHNFVIKPGYENLAQIRKDRPRYWEKIVKRYTTITPKDIHCFYAVRHPKMSWVTVGKHKRFGVDHFINFWNTEEVMEDLERYTVVKIECLEYNDILKRLLNVDLSKVKSYTEFDLDFKKTNTYETLDQDFVKIEKELDHIFKYLIYDKDDDAIQEFLNEPVKDKI